MSLHLVLTIVTAALNLAAAVADFLRPAWILNNMASYGVPRGWLPALGVAKLAGGLGLLVGLAVPALGVAAAVGLLLYFAGAVVTVARARVYPHLPYPGVFLLLVAGTLAVSL